jgi:hypothetical protein
MERASGRIVPRTFPLQYCTFSGYTTIKLTHVCLIYLGILDEIYLESY